jgi:hypothetical protein
MTTIEKIGVMLSIIQAMCFGTASVFYWYAYIKMKRTKIIGSLAFLFSSSFLCLISVSIAGLFVEGYLDLGVFSLRLLSIASIIFFLASSFNDSVR